MNELKKGQSVRVKMKSLDDVSAKVVQKLDTSYSPKLAKPHTVEGFDFPIVAPIYLNEVYLIRFDKPIALSLANSGYVFAEEMMVFTRGLLEEIESS